MAKRSQKGTFKLSYRPYEMRTKQFGKGSDSDDSEAFYERPSIATEALESTLESASNWRAAKALTKLRAQLDTAFPNRSKASDGIIGDLAHCPGSSDHCPNIADGGVGVVTAFDATHDPGDCDIDKVVEAVIASQDKRIKYIIWRRRICSSYVQNGVAAWKWRPYNGANPHNKHAHFSVLPQKTRYDNTSAWTIA